MRDGSARLQWVVRACLAVGVAAGAFGLAGYAGAETGDSQQRAVTAPPASGKLGDRWRSPKDGAEMAYVPAGWFVMGSTMKEIDALVAGRPGLTPECFADETPQRRVYLAGYWICRTAVTVAQFRRFCAATGRPMPEAPPWGWKADHPVVNVSWGDAKAYCDWAGLALPTEAQWEKAARGTDGRVYPWGNDWDPEKAVCSRNPGEDAGSTAPVGSKPAGASPYGCLDMAGNVWQWCADWYSPGYAGKPNRNPAGPASGTYRSLRGAPGFSIDAATFRAAYRYNVDPAVRYFGFGFRTASRPASR